jgi:hypothetical protein
LQETKFMSISEVAVHNNTDKPIAVLFRPMERQVSVPPADTVWVHAAGIDETPKFMVVMSSEVTEVYCHSATAYWISNKDRTILEQGKVEWEYLTPKDRTPNSAADSNI